MNRNIKPYLRVAIVSLIVVCLAQQGLSRSRSAKRLPVGKWGGEHINLEVTDTGINIEFDCASSSVKGPVLLKRHGKFSFSGTYARQFGAQGFKESHPARFVGWTDGKRMKLKVTFTDTNQVAGNYTLEAGKSSQLDKCPAQQKRSEEDAARPSL